MNVIENGDMFNCDCGFSWRRGQRGAHHCGDGLRKQISALKEELNAVVADGYAMKMNIARQLTIVLKNLNAPSELLFLIGSYGDTQSDEEILEMLDQYNECGTFVHEVIAPAYQWKPSPDAAKGGSDDK